MILDNKPPYADLSMFLPLDLLNCLDSQEVYFGESANCTASILGYNFDLGPVLALPDFTISKTGCLVGFCWKVVVNDGYIKFGDVKFTYSSGVIHFDISTSIIATSGYSGYVEPWYEYTHSFDADGPWKIIKLIRLTGDLIPEYRYLTTTAGKIIWHEFRSKVRVLFQ